MLKKLALVLAASAFAFVLSAPAASACPAHGKHAQKTAEKDSAKTKKAADQKTTKTDKTDKTKTDKTKTDKVKVTKK